MLQERTRKGHRRNVIHAIGSSRRMALSSGCRRHRNGEDKAFVVATDILQLRWVLQRAIRAALDAGYDPSTAENTKQKIMSRPEVREAFNELLNEHLPPEKLVRCIVEGLDANQVKFFLREGDVIETVVLPDHRIRLLFLVLALKLKGWDLPPAEVNRLTSI